MDAKLQVLDVDGRKVSAYRDEFGSAWAWIESDIGDPLLDAVAIVLRGEHAQAWDRWRQEVPHDAT